MIFKCPPYAEARVREHELFRGIPGAEEAGLDARVQELMNPRPGLLYPGFCYDMMIWPTSWSHALRDARRAYRSFWQMARRRGYTFDTCRPIILSSVCKHESYTPSEASVRLYSRPHKTHRPWPTRAARASAARPRRARCCCSRAGYLRQCSTATQWSEGG
jgi:hypothetical protein